MGVTTRDLQRIFDEVIELRNSYGMNHRFNYAKVRRLDKWYFVKIAMTNESMHGLENEALWCEFMDRVDVLAPNMKLQGPHITQVIGRDALVFEFIGAPMVAEPGNANAWRTHLDRYTETLIKLDKLSGDFSLSHIYTKLNHPYEFHAENWHKILETYDVDLSLINRTKKLYKQYGPHITLRLQHNDMSPWQIFEQGDRWVIIDGEKANLQSPRFNDVGMSYVRMHNTARDPALAKVFLRQFVAGIGLDDHEFYRQFIAVMTMRSIGSLADAMIDKPTNDYIAEASALLDMCLSGDPAALF